MQWDEFTNYIIEKAAVLNTMKNKNEEIKAYYLSPTRVNMKFSKVVKKCIYISIINRIAFFEEEGDIVYFADPKTGQIDESKELHVRISDSSHKSDGINPPVHIAKKAMLLDMIFIEDPKYNLLVTSSNDGVIRMFKYANNRFKPADDSNQRDHEIIQGNAQMTMVWDSVDEILYSGQRDGIIRVWDQKSEPQYSQLGGKPRKNPVGRDPFSNTGYDSNMYTSNRIMESQREFQEGNSENMRRGSPTQAANQNQGHTDVVTAILPLNKLQFLASASLDKKIILWDTIEKTKKREYCRHKKGIMTLDFNENMILLISGGFDHEIYVWNPYIHTPVHKLSGHAAPIVSLLFINNPLHVVSLDSDFTLKIWDIKKFKCVDTFLMRENSEDKKKFLPQGICLLKNPLKLVIPAKHLSFLEYDRNDSLTSADENVSICAKFVPSNLSLLTPVRNKIKLWNLLTGEVKKIFSDITKNDISFVNLDEKSKRFMLGDTEGFIGVYNVNNGALLKTLQKHKSEIIGLRQSEKYKIIVSASLDNVVKIHEDNDLDESDCLRTFQANNGNITAMSFDFSKGRVVLGSNIGALSIHEATTGKGNDEFAECDEEITCIVFLNGYSSLIYANSVGQLKVLAVSPLVLKNIKLCQFTNKDEETRKGISITKMEYCKNTHRLFFADEHHNLKCFSLDKLISELAYKNKESSEKTIVNQKIKTGWIKKLWEVKAHDDLIRSLEYISSEELLFTTCVDKSVRIFSSKDGKFIESLRQRKDSERIKPIAYKKVESEEIYTPRMENRIDARHKKKQRFIKKRVKKIQDLQDQGINEFYDLEKEFDEYHGAEPEPLEAFKEYEAQEFDPYYYFEEKLDEAAIQGKKSNNWRLYLKFDEYYKDFEGKVDKICGEVKTLEDELESQGESIKKFKGSMSQSNPKNKLQLAQDASQMIQPPGKKIKKQLKYSDKFGCPSVEREMKMKLKMEEKWMKIKKKGKSKLYKQLYKQGVKKDMIKKMNNEPNKIRLFKSEIDAARKLAAALADYDPDDPRSLMFTGFEAKKVGGKRGGKAGRRKRLSRMGN